MTQKRQKFIAHTTRGLDDNGLVEAVVSTEAVDRDGDIIRASGWDLDNFIEHPVLIASHDYSSLLNQIGEWTDIGVQGKRLVGKVQYLVGEGNPEVDWGFKLAKRGQAAYSVGFIPDMTRAKELKNDGGWATYEFRGQELLEVSHVTIPSNYECLQRIKGLDLHPVIREVVDGLLSDVPDLSGGNADGTFTAAQMSQLRELFAEFARTPELAEDEQLAPVMAHLEANTMKEHIARWFSS